MYRYTSLIGKDEILTRRSAYGHLVRSLRVEWHAFSKFVARGAKIRDKLGLYMTYATDRSNQSVMFSLKFSAVPRNYV